MSGKNAFFAAPDLSDDEVVAPKKAVTASDATENDNLSPIGGVDALFISTELNGSPKGIHSQGKPKRTHGGSSAENVPCELTEDLRKKWSAKLLDNTSSFPVRNVVIDSSKERVIIRFVAQSKSISCDIEVPLDITANDLIVGLNDAYKLGIDLSDIRQCYMSCENPVALLKGKRLLGEYGIRDGSLITYYR